MGTTAPLVTTAKLTARQRETLRLLALGCSETEIAAKLGMSRRTVQAHIWGARRRFKAVGVRVKTVIDLARAAVAYGVITIGELAGQ